ncbi:MAG: DEAD/DEAH box helicase [Planctomycetaceae bacterium]|nr:DEAD/DEAH box helicase [Planctomycetaceae bacterium]
MLQTESVISSVAQVIAENDEFSVLYDPPQEPFREGRFEPLANSCLHPGIVKFLEEVFPQGLFQHQHLAIEEVLQGRNTVVATRTSSGKSLIYSLPAFHELCCDEDSTALLLFPQKALANDQLSKLRDMAEQIPTIANLQNRKPDLIARYDGSVSDERKPLIRQEAQILLTNPDMLHFGLLQHHERHWTKFFSNLKLIVIDECHDYRGVFGTNVAYILHRLKQVCQLYGSNPKFIATSATISDPQRHMEQLTGEQFVCISPEQDGSQQGARKFWMVDSESHYFDTGRKMAKKLVDAGLTVLTFCPSRISAERMLSRFTDTQSDEDAYVRVYRSGLSAEERQEIEDGLRNGKVRLVFSTSALELGIDIGSIDVVLCIGLPNSMMSLWQRAGRSARGGREGVSIFIPAEKPIDSYYANHPDELFQKENEPLVLNMHNQRIVCQHYACAVQEVGGDEDRLIENAVGTQISQIKSLRADGQLNRDEFYRSQPHMEINIRSSGEGAYALMVGDSKLGEIDSIHLLRECSRNAIYRHGGRAFKVKDVIQGKRVVRLHPIYTRNETSVFIQKKIRLKQQYKKKDYSCLRIAQVSIDVSEFLVNVVEKDRSGQTVHCWNGSQGMPTNTLPTEGTMLLFQKCFWDQFAGKLGIAPREVLSACEHLFCSLFPTVSGPCDTQDFSSGIDSLSSGELAIFIYDMVYDGVDMTNVAFDLLESLVERTIERITNCDCERETGCIRCVLDPYGNPTASKEMTLEVLRALLNVIENETPVLTEAPADWSRELLLDNRRNCPCCDTEALSTARFCSNCGEQLETI